MSDALTLRSATIRDAAQVAEIHLTSRRTAMPWLAQPHTDDETRSWFSDVLLPGGTVIVAEIHGAVVRRTEGADNEEHEPDVLLHWSPADPPQMA